MNLGTNINHIRRYAEKKNHNSTYILYGIITCSQNRQSTKFQNHENINFVEKLYFFILYNQVHTAKHDVNLYTRDSFLGKIRVITKLEGK